jgi:hypothetical protein
MVVSPPLEQRRDIFMWIQSFNSAECVLQELM